jgi:hypothetical protein
MTSSHTTAELLAGKYSVINNKSNNLQCQVHVAIYSVAAMKPSKDPYAPFSKGIDDSRSPPRRRNLSLDEFLSDPDPIVGAAV